MPVIDRRGKPLDDNHPFKGTRIIFGVKKPLPEKVGQPATDERLKAEADKKARGETPKLPAR